MLLRCWIGYFHLFWRNSDADSAWRGLLVIRGRHSDHRRERQTGVGTRLQKKATQPKGLLERWAVLKVRAGQSEIATPRPWWVGRLRVRGLKLSTGITRYSVYRADWQQRGAHRGSVAVLG